MSRGRIAWGPMRFFGCLRCLPSGFLTHGLESTGVLSASLVLTRHALTITPHTTVAHPGEFRREINPLSSPFPFVGDKLRAGKFSSKSQSYAVPQADRRRISKDAPTTHNAILGRYGISSVTVGYLRAGRGMEKFGECAFYLFSSPIFHSARVVVSVFATSTGSG